jgi:phosphoglycolate phosphatase
VSHRAVVFDLDGTLADTLATIANVANFALRSMQLPEHPVDAYRTMVGDGVSVLCQRALPTGRADLHAELLARVRARYATHYLDQAKLYDGVHELLLALSKAGARLGVLSNKPHDVTVKTVEGLGVAPLFQVVCGQREAFKPKPDAACALDVQRRLAVAASEVLYVGDTAIDMDTARAAGFTPVGVLWGFRSRAELVEHGARHLVAKPMEIVPLYLQGR